MKQIPFIDRSVKTIYQVYQRARSRKELAELDLRALNDIGLTRADQIRECRKPFWRK